MRWRSYAFTKTVLLARELLEMELHDAEKRIADGTRDRCGSWSRGGDGARGYGLEEQQETKLRAEDLLSDVKAEPEDIDVGDEASILVSTRDQNYSTPFALPLSASLLLNSDARTSSPQPDTISSLAPLAPPAAATLVPPPPPSSNPFPLPVLYLNYISSTILIATISCSLAVRASPSPILPLEHKVRALPSGAQQAYAFVWLDPAGMSEAFASFEIKHSNAIWHASILVTREAVAAVDDGVFWTPALLPPVPPPAVANLPPMPTSENVRLLVSPFPSHFTQPELRALLELHLRPRTLRRVILREGVDYIDIATEGDRSTLTVALEGQIPAPGSQGLTVRKADEESAVVPPFAGRKRGRAMSVTSQREITIQHRPSEDAGQEELDEWGIYAFNGRFPPDYPQYPPEVVARRLQERANPLKMPWRS